MLLTACIEAANVFQTKKTRPLYLICDCSYGSE
jgi:hypothetical protein